MPLTLPYQAELDRLYRENEAFERRYASTRYNAIPADELQARRDRDIALWNATREANYATSPEDGHRFDLESREFGGSFTDEDRLTLAELRRPVFDSAVNWDSRKGAA